MKPPAKSHAKLSPSAADRWMACPGSVVLSEGIPQRTSKYADEGTAAHELAEKLLSGEAIPESTDPDTLKAVMVYVDYVEGLRAAGGELIVEQRVYVDEDIHGTADAVVWNGDTKTLYVIDYKHGAGVPVEVRGNLQLKIYALAALLTYKFPADIVVATIVQPRCEHPDGALRAGVYGVVELMDFFGDLLDAKNRVRRAIVGGKAQVLDHLTPTEKGCRWCVAAPVCPALKEIVTKNAFADIKAYSVGDLAEALEAIPFVKTWIKSVEELAYSEANHGVEIPGWKLVAKRAIRRWADDAEAGAALFDAIREQAYEPGKVKSPAAIEAFLKNPNNGVAKPEIIQKILDSLCVKESSGTTLVPVDDKRLAVAVDAFAAFTDV